jgi:4'-phosphopantetheinyl transferase
MISLFSKKINEDSYIELFDISDWAVLPTYELNNEEKVEFTQISNENRKREWIISRFLLKNVCDKLAIGYYGTYKDEIGRIWLKNSKVFISISHTDSYCGIIVSKNGFCGIDTELISERILKLSSKFLSKEENAIAAHNQELCTLIWSAKEAMYKVCGKKGIIFAKDLKVYIKDNELEGKILNPENFTNFILEYKIINKLIIVWLLQK